MTTDYDYAPELAVAQAIARRAGVTMLQYFDGDQQVERKSDGSPVTIADKLINAMVIEELAKAFPDDGVIGEEESNTEYGMGRKWFCDPIDGTKAYTWGTPTSMFSLALVVDGVPVVGVAYDPFLDRLYSGIKGRGSDCNGHKLQVNTDGLPGGFVAVTSEVGLIASRPPLLEKLSAKGARLVTFSGAVYKAVLVARGRMAGYVESRTNAHDVAAVDVIVTEAGGRVSGLDGKPFDYTKPFRGMIVSNGVVHDDIVEAVA